MSLISLWHFSEGQVKQTKRFEIELDQFDEYFTVVSTGEQGVVLFREIEERGAGGDKGWEVIKLDSMLQQEWAKVYYIDSEYIINGYDYHQEDLFLLYNNGPYSNDEFLLARIDLQDQSFTSFNITKNFAIALTEFEMVGNSAILGGYINYRPTVVLYNFVGEKLIVLPGFYLDRSELIQVEVDDDRNIFRILTTAKTYDKRNTVSVKTFDETGEMLLNTMLEPESGLNLLYGHATTIIGDQQFLAGTYSQFRSASSGAESYSRGIFIGSVDAAGEQTINYYNYGDLENFFNYMKVKRKERVQRRIERRRIKGKKVKFNYRLLVHDVIPRGDTYIMLGEAYYPTYSNRSSFSGFNYNPFMSGSSFAGYRYTHAVLIGFDSEGNLLWDNSFEINDVVSYRLEQYVHTIVEEDRLVLLYLYEDQIRSKIIEKEQVIEGKSFNDIELKFQDDVVKNNDYRVGGLEKWYDKNFIAYGVQKIRNLNDPDINLNREVFYINKIVYR